MQGANAASSAMPARLQGLIATTAQALQTEGSLSAILAKWHDTGGHLWLDVTAPDSTLLAELNREFQIDTQALVEILDPHHKAHVREYEDYFFLQLPLPSSPVGELENRRPTFSTEELDIICGRTFILTLHAQPQNTLHALWERQTSRPSHKWAGHLPDSLLYEIGDAVLSAFYPHLEWLEDQHDYLERLIFAGHRSQIQRVVFYKRHLHALRRVIAPLRDAMAALAKREFVLLDHRHRYLFDELFARSVRLLEFVENLRSLFDGLLNADLALQNNRMNEVMKTLTVVATIMMPLTVLTGFFGMNFEHIPGLHSPAAFWTTTSGMLVLAIGLVWFFRRRGWW